MSIRTVPLATVTTARWNDVMAKAERAPGYIHSAVTVLDAAGGRTNRLMPNGMVIVENAYTEIVLYLLPSGELVRLEQD
jgi:hypothetical protein